LQWRRADQAGVEETHCFCSIEDQRRINPARGGMLEALPHGDYGETNGRYRTLIVGVWDRLSEAIPAGVLAMLKAALN
jgi:hypothetical protein